MTISRGYTQKCCNNITQGKQTTCENGEGRSPIPLKWAQIPSRAKDGVPETLLENEPTVLTNFFNIKTF